MRLLPLSFFLLLTFIMTGCLPIQPSQPVAPPPAPVLKLSAGPYWHSDGPEATLADALAYYGALKPLTSDELDSEHKRLLQAIESSPGDQVPALQLVLLAGLPDQKLVTPEQAIKFLETARQNADLHRQLADLFILLNDQLTSHVTVQAQSKQGSQTLRSTRKKLTTQSEDLNACRQERDDLAEKLQKLQNIERDLIDRDRKKP
ncbi:MAG: hypothetical protein PHI06_04680 [Desulfobulbaceae bacterium]|nr:hypothetical protein [Desulfobulbaceae bacterium]